jgi:hypothetical protein
MTAIQSASANTSALRNGCLTKAQSVRRIIGTDQVEEWPMIVAVDNLPVMQRKSFTAESPWGARAAASAWLSDFSLHGPVDIASIRVVEDEETFTAVVTYAPMKLEDAPARVDPPMRKSA